MKEWKLFNSPISYSHVALILVGCTFLLTTRACAISLVFPCLFGSCHAETIPCFILLCICHAANIDFYVSNYLNCVHCSYYEVRTRINIALVRSMSQYYHIDAWTHSGVLPVYSFLSS